ncbi:hypothetical protein D3C78_1497130 [compost metagenome]
MRVIRQISGRLRVHVGKVTASAAGHQDFAPRFFAVVEQQHPAAELPCLRRAKHARCARTYYHDIKLFHLRLSE